MKPILFNPEMVRAILDGRKKVMRRVVTPQPLDKIAYVCMGHKHGIWTYPSDDVWKYWGEEWRREQPLPETEKNRRWTPPCHTDDILYVRETWRVQAAHRFEADVRIEYKAGGSMTTIQFPGRESQFCSRAEYDAFVGKWANNKWRPSIHMPKEAARLFLRVTDVRVERLQDIDYEGYKAEGIWDDYKTVSEQYHENLARRAYPVVFAELWDSTIKKADLPLYGYDENPWVWVIEFERISKEEAMK